MSKNRKAKGKGKTKDETMKLSNFDDAFYRLTIEDCEKKIDRLRKHLEHLDTNNDEIKEKIRSLGEDQVDKSADLTRELHSLDETVYKYKEELYELQSEYKNVKSRGDATITDLEEKHKAMHDQLTSEIKLLKEKLQRLEDFRRDQTKLCLVIENEEKLLDEKKQEYGNDIAQMERKIKIEKEVMQKEIETKLLRESEELTHSTAMRNATYAQRLIRENIALQKEIEVLNITQNMMDEQLQEHIALSREVMETFPALKRKKRELIFVAQQRTNLVEKITTKYEKLRNAYTESLQYKNQFQDLMQYQLCRHYKQHQMLTQAKKLSSKANTLKEECLLLGRQYDENETEISRLRKVISLIRKTILDALEIYETPIQVGNLDRKFQDGNLTLWGDSEGMGHEIGRNEELGSFRANGTLLETLLEILKSAKVCKSRSVSLETVSPDEILVKRRDLVQSSDSLRGIFKHSEQKELHGVSAIPDEVQLSKQSSMILIPKQRTEHCEMFDVETGTSLYMSSSRGRSKIFVEEQAPDDFKVSSSSYSSFSSENLGSKASTLPSQAKLVPSGSDTVPKAPDLKMAPGTIVDVELDENDEEERHEEFDGKTSEEDVLPTEVTGDEDEMSVYMFY